MNAEALFQPGSDFFLIAGPCVLEDHELHLEIAAALWNVRRALAMPVIFKGSFDKANRANRNAERGPGLVAGLKMLEQVKADTYLPVLTDIHEAEQAKEVAEVCDVLQIPAFLCRQTDLLTAAAATHKPINIKKGQWMGPDEMLGAVNKVRGWTKDYPVAVTERGTFFGYGDIVVDMRNIPRMREACKAPVIFDATHTIQRPGLGPDGASGGFREYILPLALAAVAMGADGLYVEVHPRPEEAPSDSASMLPLDQLLPLMQGVVTLRREVLLQPRKEYGQDPGIWRTPES